MPLSLLPIILMIASLGQVAADVYLPSLPAIANYFESSTTYVQLTVTTYMVGMGFSQLFYGPISDAIGRKKPLLFGVILVLLGSIVCLFSHNIIMLILGRCLQGAGAGAGMAIARAIGRDVFEGDKIAKIAAYLSIANVAIMASAPFIGGLIETYLNWHMNFLFLSVYSVLILIIIHTKFEETNQNQHRDHLKVAQLKLNLITLLRNQEFISYALISAAAYGGVIAWLTVGAVLLQETLGLTPVEFGILALLNGVVFGIGALFTAKIVMRLGAAKLVQLGTSMIVLSTLLALLFYAFEYLTVLSFILPIYLYTIGTSSIFSSAFAKALHPFPNIAGFSGSIFGTLQIVGGMLSSGFVSYSPDHDTHSLVIVFASISLLCVGLQYLLKFKIKSE